MQPVREAAGRGMVKSTRSLRSLLVAWLPPVAWAVFLFCCSSFTLGSAGRFLKYVPGGDKTVHFVMYGVLGALTMRALAMTTTRRGRWGLVILACLIGGFYGLTDELHQTMVRGRTAELLDVVADTIGSFFGAAAWTWTSTALGRYVGGDSAGSKPCGTSTGSHGNSRGD